MIAHSQICNIGTERVSNDVEVLSAFTHQVRYLFSHEVCLQLNQVRRKCRWLAQHIKEVSLQAVVFVNRALLFDDS